jgi:hypothetical protein
MVVVGHQAVGPYPDVPQPGGFLQHCYKAVIIGIIFIHQLAAAAAIHYVVPGARKFYA